MESFLVMVQWMTAGAGVVHWKCQREFAHRWAASWTSTLGEPASSRQDDEARYQEISAERIPTAQTLMAR